MIRFQLDIIFVSSKIFLLVVAIKLGPVTSSPFRFASFIFTFTVNIVQTEYRRDCCKEKRYTGVS